MFNLLYLGMWKNHKCRGCNRRLDETNEQEMITEEVDFIYANSIEGGKELGFEPCGADGTGRNGCDKGLTAVQ